MGRREVNFVDLGALLTPDDPEYDAYVGAYDGEHGYYDDVQFYSDKPISEILDLYEDDMKDGWYVIISRQVIYAEPDEDVEELEIEFDDIDYSMDAVIYAAKKERGELVPLFDDPELFTQY